MDTPICLPNIKISEDDLMCVIKRDGKTAIIDQTVRIAELEAQITTLKKIAEEERSNFLYIYFYRSIVAKPLEPIECSNARSQDARRQLAEEHPEIFGD